MELKKEYDMNVTVLERLRLHNTVGGKHKRIRMTLEKGVVSKAQLCGWKVGEMNHNRRTEIIII